MSPLRVSREEASADERGIPRLQAGECQSEAASLFGSATAYGRGEVFAPESSLFGREQTHETLRLPKEATEGVAWDDRRKAARSWVLAEQAKLDEAKRAGSIQINDSQGGLTATVRYYGEPVGRA